MQPPIVVFLQECCFTLRLEEFNELLYLSNSGSNELFCGEGVEGSAMVSVMLLDQIIYADGWILVTHIITTTCRIQHISIYQ